MNFEIENAQLKLQILSLQGHLLQFHHRDAVTHLQALRSREAAGGKAGPEAAPVPEPDADSAGKEGGLATRDEKSGIPVQ